MTPKLDPEEIAHRFVYHPPNIERAALHQDVREACAMLADYLVRHLPPSREAAMAITAVEGAMFWANAAIARTPAT